MLNPGILQRDGWLIWALTRRSLDARYRGTLFGAFWTILQPVGLLAIYAVVFAGVLHVTFPGTSTVEFVVFVFCGLIPFTMLSDTLTSANTVIVANASLVKRTPVRPYVFPLSATLAALAAQIPSLVIVLVSAALLGRLGWAALTLPLLLIPQVLVSGGLSLLVSAVGVFVRDLGQLLGLLLTAWLLVTPIFYPESAVPERLRWALWINPLAWLVTSYRDTLLLGVWPPLTLLVGGLLTGAFTFTVGLYLFGRLRPAFPDAL